MEKKKRVSEIPTDKLIEYVNRLERIYKNPALLKTLPDKGAKLEPTYRKAIAELNTRKDKTTEPFDKIKIQKIEFGTSAVWCHFNKDDSDDDDDDISNVPDYKYSPIEKKLETLSLKQGLPEPRKPPEKPLKYNKSSNPYQEIFPVYNLNKTKPLEFEESIELINQHRSKLKDAEAARDSSLKFNPSNTA